MDRIVQTSQSNPDVCTNVAQREDNAVDVDATLNKLDGRTLNDHMDCLTLDGIQEARNPRISHNPIIPAAKRRPPP